jgi:sugar phosphate isomerase/epimerase
MKIGCCLNMNAVDPYKIGTEAVPLVAELGYDYIELPLAQVMDLSGNEFAAFLDRIQDNHIPVESCNNFFPQDIRLTGAEAQPGLGLEYAQRAADRAAALGAEIIVFGSAKSKNIPPGFPRERAREQLLELLYGLQNIVNPLGITIVMEPLNRQESNFINTAAEALAVVRDAVLDNVKLLIDYYHMRMEEEDILVIREAGKDLRHVHLAAKQGRLFPRGNDGEDYESFFAALKYAGYDKRVSIEAYSENLAADAAGALRFLKPLLN